jgi:hypothetical protein
MWNLFAGTGTWRVVGGGGGGAGDVIHRNKHFWRTVLASGFVIFEAMTKPKEWLNNLLKFPTPFCLYSIILSIRFPFPQIRLVRKFNRFYPHKG